MTGDGLAAAALADLVDRLAADEPAPGAGPAAAWACAMAAALVEMVTAVELRREPADPVTVRARGERAASLRARALGLADLDVAAYTRVLDWAYSTDEALQKYAALQKVSPAVAREVVKKGYPKDALATNRVNISDLTLAEMVRNKMIDKPLTTQQVADMLKLVAVLHK